MPCGCADPPSLWETSSRTTSLPTPRNQYNLQQPSLCLLQKGHIVPAQRVMDSQRDPPPRTLGQCSCPPWTQSTPRGPRARAPSISRARANHSVHPRARTGRCIRPEAGAYRQVPPGVRAVHLWLCLGLTVVHHPSGSLNPPAPHYSTVVLVPLWTSGPSAAP